MLYAADPGASDDDDRELESLSAGSQSATRCPAMSTDSDPTVAGLDLSSLKGITGNFLWKQIIFLQKTTLVLMP